jgi:hypothetical protein
MSNDEEYGKMSAAVAKRDATEDAEEEEELE